MDIVLLGLKEVLIGLLGLMIIVVIVLAAAVVYIYRHRYDEDSVLHHNAGMIMGLFFVFASMAVFGAFCRAGLVLASFIVILAVVIIGFALYDEFKIEY
jgi:hypothetical protein